MRSQVYVDIAGRDQLVQRPNDGRRRSSALRLLEVALRPFGVIVEGGERAVESSEREEFNRTSDVSLLFLF